jgi:hypothetical protein
VIQETSFLQGLFTAEELNHENIKDRESKVAFLQKVIDAVSKYECAIGEQFPTYRGTRSIKVVQFGFIFVV